MRVSQEIGEPALLELLAEECTELAHASLKLARVERKENPTPRKKWECIAALIDEWVDVIICLQEVSDLPWAGDGEEFEQIYDRKMERMRERLEERRNHNVSGQKNCGGNKGKVPIGNKGRADKNGRSPGTADRDKRNRGRRGRYRILADEVGRWIRLKRGLWGR